MKDELKGTRIDMERGVPCSSPSERRRWPAPGGSKKGRAVSGWILNTFGIVLGPGLDVTCKEM